MGGLIAVISVATLFAGHPGTGQIDLGDVFEQPLGNWIAGDAGVPVELDDGSLLLLFGDTLAGPNDGRTVPDEYLFVHSSVLHVDGDETTPLFGLLPDGELGHYWISDAMLQPDGRLAVVAIEIAQTGGDVWGFKEVDTDWFVVRDPLDVEAWRTAEHHDDGWWDGHDVQFVDGTTYAAVQPYGDPQTWLYDMNANEATPVNAPDSSRLFLPVSHNDEWWGITWNFLHQVIAVWVAPTPTGPWVWHSEHTPSGGDYSYLPQLHVIDDTLTLQWSNTVRDDFEGADVSAVRPSYVPLTQ